MKLLDELYKNVDNLSIFDDDYDTESILGLINCFYRTGYQPYEKYGNHHRLI